MLQLKNIHKYFNPGSVNEMCLFRGYDLTVNEGEFVSVVGSNGSGKTSMLNIICGSIDVDLGQVVMNGEDITNQKRVYTPAQHRKSLSESGEGDVPEHDNSGKYVDCG